MVPPPLQNLMAIARVIAKTEEPLSRVQRWTNFAINRSEHIKEPVPHPDGQTRFQNVMAHTATVHFSAMEIIRIALKHGAQIDVGFLHQALVLHDIGEIRHAGKGDVLSPHKKISDDYDELQTFMEHVADLSPELRMYYRERFLLQFARKPTTFDAFDPSIRAELEQIERKYPLESRMFRVIEVLDYLFYALYEWQEKGHERIMVHCLRDSGYHKQFCDWAVEIPGFGAEIYTPAVIAFFDAFIAKQNDAHASEIAAHGAFPRPVTPAGT